MEGVSHICPYCGQRWIQEMILDRANGVWVYDSGEAPQCPSCGTVGKIKAGLHSPLKKRGVNR